MAVLALKFYIPSQSRTPPVSQTRAAKALRDDAREFLVLLPPFPSQMRQESEIFTSGSQREDALRERKADCQYDIPENKTSFSHSIWNRIGTFAHRRVQQDVQKDIGCEKGTLTHRFEHCDHPDCASAMPLACMPRRVFFLSSPLPSSPSACYPRSQIRCANFFPSTSRIWKFEDLELGFQWHLLSWPVPLVLIFVPLSFIFNLGSALLSSENELKQKKKKKKKRANFVEIKFHLSINFHF